MTSSRTPSEFRLTSPRAGGAILCGLLALAPARAQDAEHDWPRWRGAHFDDAARATGIFKEPFELRVRWRRALGSGYSGISVRGALAVTLASESSADFVLALDADTGVERWRHRLGPAFPGLDGAMDGPVSTPTLSADSVYALGARGDLVALALASGAPRWSVDLAARFGAPQPHWGFTTAPLLAGELVIVAAGAPEQHAFLAFSTSDGALRWSAGTDAIQYQSPVLARLGGEELVLGSGNQYLFGLDPASGAVRWRVAHGGSDFYQNLYQPLVLGDERVLLKHQRMSSRCVQVVPGEGTAALEPLWSSRYLSQNYNMAVQHEGLLFGHGGSFLACVDAESGDLVWRSRPPGDGWVILVDGHLVVLTKAGSLHVAPASPDGYEEQAALELFEHLAWTPPSFAGGRIFARDHARDAACVEIVPAAARTAAKPAAKTAATRERPASAPGRWFLELEKRVSAAGDERARAAELDACLADVRFPFVEDGRIAHFVYRGAAEEVVLRGDVLADGDTLALARLAGTDLFHAALELEPDARVGYQFVRDLDQALADPLNPRAGATITMLGPTSELLMPAAEAPPALVAPARAPETFVLDVPVATRSGRAFGGPRRVWVHLPPDYESSDARYPVVYVNDGASARDCVGVPGVLEELAARGRPAIGVLVELQGAYELARAEQDLYRDVLVERVVPHVDAHYRTLARPEARVVLGWNEGAYAALFAALSRPECFGAAAGQSLYHGSSQGPSVLAELVRAAPVLPRVALDWGRYDARNAPEGVDTPGWSRALADALRARGARVVAREANDGDQCAFWRARLPALLAELLPERRQ